MEQRPDLVTEVRERLQGMTRAEMIDLADRIQLPWQTVQKVRLDERREHRYRTIATLAAGLKLRRRY
jgi:hypothetical protein